MWNENEINVNEIIIEQKCEKIIKKCKFPNKI